MPHQFTLSVNGQQIAIDLLPITMVFHSGELDIQPGEEAGVITPEDTLAFFSELTTHKWDTLRHTEIFRQCLKALWGNEFAGGVLADSWPLSSWGMGVEHSIGLIGLMLVCLSVRRPFLLKFPETYLHPKQQANLADMFVILGTLDEKIAGLEL